MTAFARYNTPCGFLELRYTETAIYSIAFLDATPVDLGRPTPLTQLAISQLNAYFAGERKSFDFPYTLQGTPFQLAVWHALEAIPYGETRSYQDIATAIGNPNSCRAVGMANHKNPMVLVVPCHRVVGKNGTLTGYAGGLSRKSYLLDLEHSSQHHCTKTDENL